MSSAQEHPFESILFPSPDSAGREQSEDTLHDLALDQVFSRIDEDAPRASSAFRTLLPTVDAIKYRQAVFRCLEQPPLRSAVETFLAALVDCDRCDHAVEKAFYPYQAELWHLRAVVTYTAAVEGFHSALTAALTCGDESSEAWTRLANHLGDYRSSQSFADMSSDARGVQQRIAELRYNALLRGPKVTIAATDGEVDLGEQVRSTFERFRQGEVTDHRTQFRAPDLDHVQAWMLERAAEVHPGPFADLLDFARGTSQYREPELVRFTDEVRFYLAYLDHIAPMRAAGLPMSYPRVSGESKALRVSDTWDIALASRLVADDATVVTNDLELDGDERILVISGPNQGGKTTMARMFGQLHHLAAIGCPARARVSSSVIVCSPCSRGRKTSTRSPAASARKCSDCTQSSPRRPNDP